MVAGHNLRSADGGTTRHSGFRHSQSCHQALKYQVFYFFLRIGHKRSVIFWYLEWWAPKFKRLSISHIVPCRRKPNFTAALLSHVAVAIFSAFVIASQFIHSWFVVTSFESSLIHVSVAPCGAGHTAVWKTQVLMVMKRDPQIMGQCL